MQKKSHLAQKPYGSTFCDMSPHTINQTVSLSVQPFLHRWPQSVPILYNGMFFPPQNCPFPCGDLNIHLMHGFLGPPESSNDISIGSAILAGLTSVADRPTDHATRSVTIDRIYVRSTATRSKNWLNKHKAHCDISV